VKPLTQKQNQLQQFVKPLTQNQNPFLQQNQLQQYIQAQQYPDEQEKIKQQRKQYQQQLIFLQQENQQPQLQEQLNQLLKLLQIQLSLQQELTFLQQGNQEPKRQQELKEQIKLVKQELTSIQNRNPQLQLQQQLNLLKPIKRVNIKEVEEEDILNPEEKYVQAKYIQQTQKEKDEKELKFLQQQAREKQEQLIKEKIQQEQQRNQKKTQLSPKDKVLPPSPGSLVMEKIKGKTRYHKGKFFGQLLYNMKFKQGIMVYANGDKYEGQWNSDFKDGNGVMTYANGDKYEGKWHDGLQDGLGIMTYANRDKYQGYWVSGQPNGNGIMFYHNGDTYKGEWHNGEKHGNGLLNCANKDNYKGEWSNNILMNGKVNKTYNIDGDLAGTYTGGFFNGLRHGVGMMRYNNETIYVGNWYNDEKDGFGYYININNLEMYEGYFYLGLKHGEGFEFIYKNNSFFRPANNVDDVKEKKLKMAEQTQLITELFKNIEYKRENKTIVEIGYIKDKDKFKKGIWKNGIYIGPGIDTTPTKHWIFF